MLPVLVSAGLAAYQAYAGSQGSSSGAPPTSGTGTYAPGGISVGSKVIGSGSAATSVPSSATPLLNTQQSVADTTGATAGASAWMKSPAVWALIAIGAVLAYLLAIPPRRRSRRDDGRE